MTIKCYGCEYRVLSEKKGYTTFFCGFFTTRQPIRYGQKTPDWCPKRIIPAQIGSIREVEQ